jgi:hypothetical protein
VNFILSMYGMVNRYVESRCVVYSHYYILYMSTTFIRACSSSFFWGGGSSWGGDRNSGGIEKFAKVRKSIAPIGWKLLR